MKPLTLRMTNWLSYRGEHELDLSQVTLAVLSGQNGAGKSSVIDAIRFSLFGATRSGLDAVITTGENACTVEFIFALGDQAYRVMRKRSSKGGGSGLLSFSVAEGAGPDPANCDDLPAGMCWTPIDGKTTKETQEKIEHVLHMNDALFTQTACANQGNAAAFSQAKPTERKAVLSEILSLDDWEKRASIGRQLDSQVKAQIGTQRALLEQAITEADTIPALESQIGEQESLIAANTEQLEAARSQQATAQTEREETIRLQAEDTARRRELSELRQAAEAADVKLREAQARAGSSERYLRDKPNLETDLTRAQQSQLRCQELDVAHTRYLELKERRDSLLQRATSAQAEWDAKRTAAIRDVESSQQQRRSIIRETQVEVDAANDKRTRSIEQLTQRIADLNATSRLIDNVPCATIPDLVGSCQLLGNARAAKEKIPALEAELETWLADTAPLQFAERWHNLLAENEQLCTDESHYLEGFPQACPEVEDLKREAVNVAEEARLLAYDSNAHTTAREASKALPELQAALARMEGYQSQLEAARLDEETLEIERNKLLARLTTLQGQLGEEIDWDRKITKIACELAEISQQIHDSSRYGESLRTVLGGLQQRLQSAEQSAARVTTIGTEIRALERRSMILGLLSNPRDGAFSRGGIPALLIDRAIPQLEDAANEVLETLSDGRMSVALRTQRETKSKTIAETLDIVIADENGEREYEQYSGGERMRVDLALRIGLSSLLAARAGARCELLVLDEVCAPLDADGQMMFIDCLAKIADRFATVLTISHIPALKDSFPYCIEVTKNGSGSHVEIVAR